MTTPTTVKVQLKLRQDTANAWSVANPILLAGELGRESDTGKIKIGNGSSTWTALAYQPFGGQITNTDIASNAEIAVSKLADGAARQLLQTAANGTDVEWASNIDIPGTLDVTGAATFDGAVTVQGDLTVNGTETIINTQTLTVEDKNIELGKIDTPTDATADGGGITLKGTTDKTINWVDATDAWTFSEHVNIASAKEYRIAGTKVLDATSLGSAVVTSSLTSVGTIGTGAWEGTAIDKTYLDATLVSTGDTGTVTSTMIADGTIVDADINASAGIVDTKLATIATAGKVSNSATTATSANTASAIVARDASGNFTAGTITAALTGVASSNVLKAGDTMTGALVVPLADAATPSVTFTGDTNTGIFSPGADQVAVATNGVERVEFGTSEVVFNDGGADVDFRVEGDTKANLLFVDAGSDEVSFRDDVKIDSSGRLLIGTSSSSTTAKLIIEGQANNATAGPFVKLQRGEAASSITVGDGVGGIDFCSNDGSVFARIVGQSDGTAGTDDYPGRILFSTTADGASSPTERMRINNAGAIFFPSVGTTASAANAFLNSGSSPVNQLLRSTSSLRYKTDIENIEEDRSAAIIDFRPVWYRSTAEADRNDWSWYGLIAEEVAEIEPRLVHWTYLDDAYEEIDGEKQLKPDAEMVPDGVQYERLTVLLLDVVKRQQQAIETLEAKVAALEAA